MPVVAIVPGWPLVATPAVSEAALAIERVAAPFFAGDSVGLPEVLATADDALLGDGLSTQIRFFPCWGQG